MQRGAVLSLGQANFHSPAPDRHIVFDWVCGLVVGALVAAMKSRAGGTSRDKKVRSRTAEQGKRALSVSADILLSKARPYIPCNVLGLRNQLPQPADVEPCTCLPT